MFFSLVGWMKGTQAKFRCSGRNKRRTLPPTNRFARAAAETLEERIVPALSVVNDTVAASLVSTLLGPGVTASNQTLISKAGTGTTKTTTSASAGTFAGGTGILGFESGIILSSGGVQKVVGPNSSDSISQNNSLAGDSALTALAGVSTRDATILEFDFVPKFSTISFNYVFSSEEYNEFANSSVNDAFGFFVNGVNAAIVPGTTNTPVSINTVNGGKPFGTNAKNSQFFINNDKSDGAGNIDTEMDGLTVVLTATATVNANQVNHIKLAIADGGDSSLDSNVFIQAGSFASQGAGLSITDASVIEGTGNQLAVFTVSLTKTSSQDVTMDYATADGTANAGSDYTATSGSLVIPAGQTSATISVPITSDAVSEGDENFVVNLTNFVNTSVSDDQGGGTIKDNTLSIDDVSVTEGTTIAVFTLTLANPSSLPVTVDYATFQGTALAVSDYVDSTGTITFAPGETSKTISVPILDDSKYESGEEFVVNLSASTNASLTDSQGKGSINDTDVPPILTINDISLTEGTGNTQNAVFTVNLSAAIDYPVTVDFTCTDGTAIGGADYVTSFGTLTFAAGETKQTITVAIVGDALFEAAETFLVTLSGGTNATISDSEGVGTIKDNDAVTSKVSINDVVVTEGTGSAVDAVFIVSLSSASGVPVTVKYTTANSTAISPDDYTAGSGTVTFAAGETSQTITVPVIGDSSFEVSQAFFVNLSLATNASITDTQGKCTILNDDLPPGLSVSDVIVTEQSGSTVTAVFIVSLSEPSILPVKVNYATASGTALTSDYSSKLGSLIFSPGQVSKTLSISVAGDTRDELDEAFFMNLSVPYNAIISDGQGQCTITDDDATPALMIDNKTVTEGTGSTVRAIFTVRLSAASGLPVTVSYATEDDTAIASADYTSASNSLTFLPGQISKTISVPITGDALDEANEIFFVNLVSPNNATLANNQALGTITDNDATPKLWIGNLTVTEGNSGTVDLVFTVKLSAASSFPVTVNYATANGSATAGSDYNSANGSLTFNPGEITKMITVSILGDSIHEQLSKTFSLSLSNALNALFANSQGIGTILDND